MGAEVALQKALFDALTGIGLRTYDISPQKVDGGNAAEFPYSEVGAIILSDLDTKGDLGFDFVARIHTFDRTPGMKACKLMQGAIYDRLHHGALTVEGFRLIMLRRQMSDCVRLPDGTYNGTDEYRGLIEAT